jgi:bifunctional DNA-binding transcriptional regulator/antitoxin component of YhaV-PrlF toxin-antitoxin module
MARSNTISVMQLKNLQFIITFPKGLANSLRLKKGDKLEYLFINGEIVIRKV